MANRGFRIKRRGAQHLGRDGDEPSERSRRIGDSIQTFQNGGDRNSDAEEAPPERPVSPPRPPRPLTPRTAPYIRRDYKRVKVLDGNIDKVEYEVSRYLDENWKEFTSTNRSSV